MFRSEAGRVAKAVMVLLAVLTPTAIAQPEAPPGQVAADSLDKADVRLVHLDILVTDRGGRPVTDLSAEDFEVLDEGDPRHHLYARGGRDASGLEGDRRDRNPRLFTRR